VQITAADGGSGYFDQGIIWMLEFWEGSLFNGDFEGFYFELGIT
jgi:hypothetical protein